MDIFQLILVVLCLTNCSCLLIKVPINMVATSEVNKVKFERTSNLGNPLKWFAQFRSSLPMKQIFSRHQDNIAPPSAYCEIEIGEPGSYLLHITTKEDVSAQTYICLEPGTNQKFSAELIKIGQTNCSVNLMDNYVNVTCTVPFRGNWAPVIECDIHGTPLAEGNYLKVTRNESVSVTFVVPINMTGSNGTCITRFDLSGKPKRTNANNVPNYFEITDLQIPAIHTSTYECPENDKKTTSHEIFVIVDNVVTVIIVVAVIPTIIALVLSGMVQRSPKYE